MGVFVGHVVWQGVVGGGREDGEEEKKRRTRVEENRVDGVGGDQGFGRRVSWRKGREKGHSSEEERKEKEFGGKLVRRI